MVYGWYIEPKEYEKAEENGISNAILNNRVRECGWDIERACKEPLHRKKLKNILTNEIIKTLGNNGITINAFTKRVLNLGWDIEKAIKTPLYSKKEAMLIANDSRRRISEEQYQRAERNGIARGTLRKRIVRSGWDMEKAINTLIMSHSECAKLSYFDKYNTMDAGYNKSKKG